MQRLKLTIIVNVVLIALTISYLYADEREKRVNVKTVKQELFLTQLEVNMGVALSIHFPASDVTAHIGLIIDGKEYILGVRPLKFYLS